MFCGYHLQPHQHEFRWRRVRGYFHSRLLPEIYAGLGKRVELFSEDRISANRWHRCLTLGCSERRHRESALAFRQSEDVCGTAPRDREAGAAMTVVVNDGAAVAQAIAFETDS